MCVIVKSCPKEVRGELSLCFMSNSSKARNSSVGKVIIAIVHYGSVLLLKYISQCKHCEAKHESSLLPF